MANLLRSTAPAALTALLLTATTGACAPALRAEPASAQAPGAVARRYLGPQHHASGG